MRKRIAQVVPTALVVSALAFGAIAPASADTVVETPDGGASVAVAPVSSEPTPSAEPTRSTRTVEETVTVTFDTLGGTSTPAAKTLLAGQSFDDAGLALPMAWKAGGWWFVSWNTEADGSGTTVTASTVITSNTTLYAQWYLRPGVDVTFDGNGGTSPRSIGLYEDQTVITGGKTLPTSTRDGYTFVGWNTAADGSGTTFTGDTPVHVSLTVYAQWLSYPVTFDGNGATSTDVVNVFADKTMTESGKTLPVATRRGYAFAGWNTAADGSGTTFTTGTLVSGAMTVFAQWTPNATVTVTFDGNGGNSQAPVSVLSGQAFADAGKSVPATGKTGGFYFRSWNTAADGSGATFTADTIVETSVTVYAQFEVRPGVSITFDGNGGTSPTSVPLYEFQTMVEGNKTMPSATRAGYTFAGWNTAADGSGTAFTTGTVVPVSLTVYAQWTANATVSVAFDANGGAVTPASVDVLTDQSLADAGQTMPSSTRVGYAFGGWNTAADGSGAAFTTGTVVSAPVTVYAIWIANATVSVAFDANGGAVTPASVDVLADQSLADAGQALPTPTRAGFTFDGWNTAADGSGVTFTDAAAITADVTVFAQWTEIPAAPGPGGNGSAGTGSGTGGGTAAGAGSATGATTSASTVNVPAVVADAEDETGRGGSTPESSTATGAASRVINTKVNIAEARVLWRQQGARWVQLVRVGKPGAYKFVETKKSVAIPSKAVFVVVTSGDAVKAPSKNKGKAKAQVRALAERYDGYIAPAVAGSSWRGNARIVAVW